MIRSGLMRSLAAAAALLLTPTLLADLLVQHGAETTSRFNANAGDPLPGGYTSPGSTVFTSAIVQSSANSVRLDTLTLGIRRLANAPSVSVHVFLAAMDTNGDARPESLTDLGIQTLVMNGPAAVTQPVVISLGGMLEVPLTDLAGSGNPGFAGFWVGLRFEGENAADALNGWRIVNAPAVGVAFNYFWGYDPSVPIEGYWYFTSLPVSYFYLDVEGALLTAPPPPPCVGDLDGDGVVNGADLGVLLATWDGPGAGDLTGNGITDGIDLGLLLANWGECVTPIPGSIYGATVTGLTMTLATPEGPRIVSGDAELLLHVGLADETGRQRVTVRKLTLDLGSTPVLGTSTGGIDLQPLHEMPPGTLSHSGQLSIPLSFHAHYWLIESTHPSTYTSCTEVDPQDGFTAAELWTGSFTGVGFETAESFTMDGAIDLNSTVSYTDAIDSSSMTMVCQAARKEYPGLDSCPAEKKCNKLKVCIQPIFIGTGASDPAKTGASFNDMKARADETWAKCCIEFDWKDPIYLDKPGYKTMKAQAGANPMSQFDDLFKEVDERGEDDCIEVFFVTHLQTADGKNHFKGDGVTRGIGTGQAKSVVADDATVACDPKVPGVLAHELGHAVGGCKHPAQDPNKTGTVMENTGKAPPQCPGDINNKVKKLQCDKMRASPLAKEKNPKEPCCLSPDPA